MSGNKRVLPDDFRNPRGSDGLTLAALFHGLPEAFPQNATPNWRVGDTMDPAAIYVRGRSGPQLQVGGAYAEMAGAQRPMYTNSHILHGSAYSIDGDPLNDPALSLSASSMFTSQQTYGSNSERAQPMDQDKEPGVYPWTESIPGGSNVESMYGRVYEWRGAYTDTEQAHLANQQLPHNILSGIPANQDLTAPNDRRGDKPALVFANYYGQQF